VGVLVRPITKNTRLCRIQFLDNRQLKLFGHKRSYHSKVQNGNKSWPSRKIPWIVTTQKTHAIILSSSPLKYPQKNPDCQNAKLGLFSG